MDILFLILLILLRNPGINLEKYITGLREKGYFYYRDIEEQDSSLIITSKTERYLENEANVSLKR